jgi:hypothetical protein
MSDVPSMPGLSDSIFGNLNVVVNKMPSGFHAVP